MNRVAIVAAGIGAVALAAGVYLLRDTKDSPEPVRREVAAERPSNTTATTAIPTTSPVREPERTATRRATPKAPDGAPTAEAPVAETGSLRVVSDVAGAQVFLDRQFIGAAPVTASDLKPGTYQLNVSAQGFEAHVETVEITAAAREISVNFRAVRLDASLDVIHKHRMGSCRGRLVATPAGLRYDTSDKDDVFTAGLLDLDTFQVDYLNKSLRIQPRRGKRYDFADPDGNADRLFVFHRDVERARERLKQGGTQ